MFLGKLDKVTFKLNETIAPNSFKVRLNSLVAKCQLSSLIEVCGQDAKESKRTEGIPSLNNAVGSQLMISLTIVAPN